MNSVQWTHIIYRIYILVIRTTLYYSTKLVLSTTWNIKKDHFKFICNWYTVTERCTQSILIKKYRFFVVVVEINHVIWLYSQMRKKTLLNKTLAMRYSLLVIYKFKILNCTWNSKYFFLNRKRPMNSKFL